jgi:hypothetical protein
MLYEEKNLALHLELLMKRKSLALTFIMVLLLLAVAGTLIVRLGRANPYDEDIYNAPPVISIFSPTQNTASTSNVMLNFTVSKSDGWTTGANTYAGILRNQLLRVKILIDGKLYRSVEVNSYLTSPFSYSENLQNLADGRHTLSLETDCEGWAYNFHELHKRKLWYKAFSDLINFTVYANPPKIQLLSVTNKTYEASDVPLTFTVNGTISKLSYSLDGLDNVSIGGNTTLADLSNGEHDITVYATDIVGNTGVSETVHFNVEVPFPTTMVIAPIASVAVVGAVLAIYFKRRKRQTK